MTSPRPRPRARRLAPTALAAAVSLATWVALAGAVAAQEACYADYKASRRDPFELHYGVAEVFGECSPPAAESELRPRLDSPDRWQLLEVVSTFGPDGLEERRDSAGDYFLRY